MRSIRAIARCRVDLGGGTLDIWPLGLLHPGAVTVNVAINLRAEIELTVGGTDYRVVQDGEQVVASSLGDLALQPAGALVAHLLSPFDPGPCTLTLETGSPRGAGLAGSSALAIALLAAAETWRDGELRLEPLERARLARDLEARLMGLPTGLQDHLPAQLGGALEIRHEPGGERVRRLDVDLEALAARLVIAYTGQSHFSAGANWSVVRGRLDGDPDRIDRLDRIAHAAGAWRRRWNRATGPSSARPSRASGRRDAASRRRSRRQPSSGCCRPQARRAPGVARRAGPAVGVRAGDHAARVSRRRRCGLALVRAQVLDAAPTALGLEVL